MLNGETFGLVLVAAGESQRLQLGQRKPYLSLEGRPVFLRSLDVFHRLGFFSEKVLVVNPKDKDKVEEEWGKELAEMGVKKVVLGGITRQASVRNGAEALEASCRWVAIHDAVRPFVRPEDVAAVASAACEAGAAILAVPMKETVKESSDGRCILRTVQRDPLWVAQTPQIFLRDRFLEVAARAASEGWETTDDAQLFERAGFDVRLVTGSYDNIKITTEADWEMAQAMVRKER